MPPGETNLTPWLTPARDTWLAEAIAWLRDVAVSLGLGEVTEVTTVRERPWSAVLRVTTSDQIVFFKAEGLGGWHEPRLLVELATDWPGLVPELLAVDESRSWLLMRDHGRPMFDVLGPEEQFRVFDDLLPLYARMQQASPPLVQGLIDAGAPDRRMHRVPRLLDNVLEGDVYGGPLQIDTALRQAIVALIPDLETICRELADTIVPDALEHGDLHDGNVLVGQGAPRLVDWGDSCVTHPFSSLFVTYDVALNRTTYDDKHRAALRLRDAYLDAWSADGSAPALRRMFVLGVWMAHLTRALDYVHMLTGATPEFVAECHADILHLLKRWVATHPLISQGDELLFAVIAHSPP